MGSQYTSEDWTQACERHNITISMDGRGRAKDNIKVSMERCHEICSLPQRERRIWQFKEKTLILPYPKEDDGCDAGGKDRVRTNVLC